MFTWGEPRECTATEQEQDELAIAPSRGFMITVIIKINIQGCQRLSGLGRVGSIK